MQKPALLDWQGLNTEIDIQQDNTVGLCWGEYGIAETGSFVVHSSGDMPVLLNFLPLYLLAVVPRSKILHYLVDYALITNDIAQKGEAPRNMCIISGASGATDIEGGQGDGVADGFVRSVSAWLSRPAMVDGFAMTARL